MANRVYLGGYPIDGTPTEGDWLWFTGAKWVPIPYGTEGAVVEMTAPPTENKPFVSNGYIVTIENLAPGHILAAMCAYIPEANRYHEYVTNVFYPDWEIGASDLAVSYMAKESVDESPLQQTLTAAKMATSYNITVS